ncbi:peptidoglycan recognition protein family protein [Nocardioides jiangxiensis]|uniref:N-acetylmuramoyl-L-alanine amidase n=1 Tax=Nocardioides jiangxiensis TaxID=3064524 RepID=A0ABT9B2G9_9ACTN|nr:N-acetylmuramoyl-L-alanine amidase [Nocardioides sp. WY-20]MDO7869052.1 N-acetylmuramoyl-L-alanine amidase [Nocardioides sp. WY-20]
MTRLGILQPLIIPALALALVPPGAPAVPHVALASGAATAPSGVGLRPGETPVRIRTLSLPGRLVEHAPRLRSTHPLPLDSAEQVAVTWAAGQPAPQVEIRTRAAARWSTWEAVQPLEDGEASEGNGTAGSDLAWVGHRSDVQIRVRGALPRGLSAVLIDPGHRDADADPRAASTPDAPEPGAPTHDASTQDASTYGGAVPAAYRLAADTTTSTTYHDTVLDSPPKTTFPTPHAPRPFIYTRHAWNADESLRPNPPEYSLTISQVHLHHTVSTNSYTRSEVPAMIRGMYSYHVKTLGWNDIGYNFLVDRFGRIWEGRYGGITYPVRGAHTLGFNHRSVGISVIGNFETAKPTDALLSSVARLAAWKLDLYGRPASGTTSRTSEGSDLYPNGEVVRLPVFDGHRDTNQTACPGRYLYARLPDLRRWAQRIENQY